MPSFYSFFWYLIIQKITMTKKRTSLFQILASNKKTPNPSLLRFKSWKITWLITKQFVKKFKFFKLNRFSVIKNLNKSRSERSKQHRKPMRKDQNNWRRKIGNSILMFLVHFSGTIKLIQPQISIAASLKWLVQSIKTLKIEFKSKIKQTEIITRKDIIKRKRRRA